MSEINVNRPPEDHVKVLDGQGWIGLLDHMGTEVTVVNGARCSFGKMKDTMDDKDVALVKYLIENKHSSPLEHVKFTFLVHCPNYVKSQWMRHRTWAYNEISRRYTSEDITFYEPTSFRTQHESDRQASNWGETDDPVLFTDEGCNDWRTSDTMKAHHEGSLNLYNMMIDAGVCREQARGVLPQNMMTTFWATTDLSNLIKFLALRDDEHAQYEIKVYAQAIKQLIKPIIPNVAEYLGW